VMENYQAEPVPQLWPWDGKGRMTKEAAMIRSDLLLGRLVRFHPDKIIFPQDVTVEPTTFVPLQYAAPKKEPAKETNIVPLPVEEPLQTVLQRRPSISMIVSTVAAFYDLTLIEICSNHRSAAIVWPRHVATWLCKKLTTHSFPFIGRHLGGRDHTTCINACRRVEARLKDDERFADEIHVIKLRIAKKLLAESAA
jgi:hypothetical protein